jgi:hypothetical protein
MLALSTRQSALNNLVLLCSRGHSRVPLVMSRAATSSHPHRLYNFIGDYGAITVDSSRFAHALWTDIRSDAFDPASGGADQDPLTAT